MSSASASSLSILSEAGFSRLSDTVFLLDPSSTSPTTSAVTTATDVSASATFEKVSNPNHPATVLYFSWMGAAPRHIIKYSSLHRQLFPSAKILLIRTDPEDFFKKKGELQEGLKPAAEFLHTASTSDSERGSAFIHTFSNGGCYGLSQLRDVYRASFPSSPPLPYKSIVIDSAPGAGTFFSDFFGAIRAFSAGLPKGPFVRRPMQFLLSIYVLLYYFSNFILRRETAIAWARRRMNDVDFLKQAERRTYVYSKKDEVIRWNEVEKHADEAVEIATREGAGTKVEKVIFEASDHVGHYRKHPVEYVEAVKRCVGI